MVQKTNGHNQLANSAVLESELQFRRLLEKLPAGAYTCDAEGLITYFNEESVTLWGRPPKLNDPVDRWCGSFKLFATDGTPIAHDQCWMALAIKTNQGYNKREIVIERPDGQRAIALAHANPIHDESGRLIGAVNVLVDITDRKRAEEELRMIRDAERARIARELHDGVLQDLAVAVQGLEATRIMRESSGSPDDLDLRQEIDALRRAVKGVREAIYDLRSEKAEPFIRTVQALLEANRQLTPEREIWLEVQEKFPTEVQETVARELLRVLQEALTNARRHSAARHVRVGLRVEGADLVAEVADDGLGFDPSSSERGLGFKGMRERMSLLGGSVEIRSEPGKGTSIRVRVPSPS